jgi:hypothetical protein
MYGRASPPLLTTETVGRDVPVVTNATHLVGMLGSPPWPVAAADAKCGVQNAKKVWPAGVDPEITSRVGSRRVGPVPRDP